MTLQLKGYLYDSLRYHLDCWAKIIKILVFIFYIFYIFYFTKTQFSITICQKLYALMHLETSEKFDKFISYQGEKRQFLSSHCHSVKGTAVIRERHSLIAGSLEIMSAVPLISNHFWYVFLFRWGYHTIVNSETLKKITKENSLSKLWWFRLLR